jgi:hypothetical protein
MQDAPISLGPTTGERGAEQRDTLCPARAYSAVCDIELRRWNQEEREQGEAGGDEGTWLCYMCIVFAHG